MIKRNAATKILAILGTALVWFPILATVFFTIAGSLAGRVLRFDYLMPAELFPAAVLGGALLIWAAIRARAQRGLIAGGLVAAFVLLFGGQGVAVATGLASGRTQPDGWQWAVVLGSIAAYSLAIIVVGVGGARLLRDLFRLRTGPS
jgi:hypothetical protein